MKRQDLDSPVQRNLLDMINTHSRRSLVGCLLSVFTSALFLCCPETLCAADALKETNTTGGLVVHLDCGDGRDTANLYGGKSFIVRGLDSSEANVAKARSYFEAKKLLGPVSAEVFDGKTLPFVDNTVTLLVADKTAVPMDELMRVIHPYGAALINGKITFKPKPATTDEWTHYLHGADNNAVARDSEVGPPRHLQFKAPPIWTRHHEMMSSISSLVTAKGRMFYMMDNGATFAPHDPSQWTITARNAFNGIFLWEKTFSSWLSNKHHFRDGPVQRQRLLVTDGDRVFITLGLNKPVSILDAASGEEVSVLKETENAEEMVLVKDMLYVLIGSKGTEHAMKEQEDGDYYSSDRKMVESADYLGTKLIKAVDTRTGRQLWRWPVDKTATIMPQTLTVAEGNVFFQESGETMSLNAATGKQVWRTSNTEKSAAGKKKNKRSGNYFDRKLGWTYSTLVVQDGVVLSAYDGNLNALDASTGKELWNCEAKGPFNKTPAVDVLVVNGVVWLSPGFSEGRDLKTGKVKAQNNLITELATAGHHHRCYRNKGSSRYVIRGHRGMEFHDTQGDNHFRHNWIRGVCSYGIMPANGLIYAPPQNCGCFPEALLHGFFALKEKQSGINVSKLTHNTTFEKGPAFGSVRKAAVNPGDWPMHRHDPMRSGISTESIVAGSTAWNASIGGRLSAPVIVGDTLLVSAHDSQQIIALDAEKGGEKWRFTAGGKVDSAPTIYGNAALFGCNDGYVYCIRLEDGQLVWRFCAAPMDLKTIVMKQVESVWPVHGSVLVSDDTAYFVAGRSTYLDGGMFMNGIDPATGSVKHKRRLYIAPVGPSKNDKNIAIEKIVQNQTDYKTTLAPDKSDGFSMAGNKSDILVADNGAIYLRHEKFDRQLNPAVDRSHHLFSTSKLLDGNESYRSHWFYGNGDFSKLPVAYSWKALGKYGGFACPIGKLMVYDGKTLWGASWNQLSLYKVDIQGLDQRLQKDFPRGKQKKIGPLAKSIPIHTRAMIKAGSHLYLAGYLKDNGVAHFVNKPIEDKGLLLQIDANSGEIVKETDLPAVPMFDGMSAANGKLYMALENGNVMCLK